MAQVISVKIVTEIEIGTEIIVFSSLK